MRESYSVDKNQYFKKEISCDNYFVLGDNRDNSKDSRVYGCISKSMIKGRGIFIWMSIDIKQIDIRWNRFFSVMK